MSGVVTDALASATRGAGLDVDDVQADLYDAFTRAHDRFAATGRALVELAGELRGADVVDLACGTGVVTGELLRASDGAARIVGVDVSPQMLARARANLGDAPVRWLCAAGERLDRAVAHPVDTIVCNAAIWYMDPDAVARAVHRALRPGGVFAFNFAHAEEPGVDLHGKMRAIAAREGLALTGARAVAPRRDLRAAIAAAGLTIARAVETSVHESVASQRDFLRLPGSTFRTLPGVPYRERLRILEMAWHAAGPGAHEPREIRWIHVRTVKPA